MRHPWGVALTNKRMALSLLARSHADIMDVGLHDIIPELMGPEGKQTLAHACDGDIFTPAGYVYMCSMQCVPTGIVQ